MSMRHPQPDKAVEYRQQAESIRVIARQISLNEARNQLLDTARHLELSAEEEERKAQQAASHSEPTSEA
jgi:hypothetical protein